ncbi:methyltransferase domain-containing protein [Patescibacteria group bacterium]|nr:methyltransferase domain-containing protein [Patescibacteria group bacterium]
MSRILTRIIDFIFPHQKDIKLGDERFWDLHWDKMNRYFKKHGEIFEINDKWDFHCNDALHEHYKSIIGSPKDLKIIECGCGGGYEGSLMARDGGNIVVMDYSSKALDYAKLVSERLKVKEKIKFIEANLLDFKTNDKYNIAWNCGVIEHYDDKGAIALIKSMMSMVETGGQVLITIPSLLSPQSLYWMITEGKGSERYITRRKLIKLMETAGLKNVKIETFSYWLPSFLPHKWAIKLSKAKFFRTSALSWLFTGVGTKI